MWLFNLFIYLLIHLKENKRKKRKKASFGENPTAELGKGYGRLRAHKAPLRRRTGQEGAGSSCTSTTRSFQQEE